MFSHENVRERIRQQPFEPFRIVTSSEDAYEVHHPDLCWVGINDLMVGHPSQRDPAYYEKVNRIALMHVTALEDLPATKSSSKGNGEQ